MSMKLVPGYFPIMMILSAAALTPSRASAAETNNDYAKSTISLQGLNLAEPSDWFKLDRRIRSAARRVCREDRTIQRSKESKCIDLAVLHGRTQANSAIARALTMPVRNDPKGESMFHSPSAPASLSPKMGFDHVKGCGLAHDTLPQLPIGDREAEVSESVLRSC